MDFWGILEYTVAVTVIGLFIWLVKLIFHDKLDARWHYFIWLVLLVRLLVPFRFGLISTPISVFQDIPLEAWIEMGRILAEKRGYGEVIIGLGKLWLLGAVLLGGFYLAMWAVLRIRIARAPKADEDVRRYVDRIAGKYGLKSCSDIRILKSSTPFICGMVRPVLVLPEDWGILSGKRVSAGGRMPEGGGVSGGREMPEDREALVGGEMPEGREALVGGEMPEGREALVGGEMPEGREALVGEEMPEGREALDRERIKTSTGILVDREKTAGSERPKDAESEAAPSEAVIVHELLHKRFGDVLINLGIHLVRAINWFNPIIWVLTSVIQNDSEALCDQRVLEYCGEENIRNYGETLISMSEGKRRNMVKVGTSDMASSYRNMKIRIRRIRDFRRVPGGVGLVTLCIVLMLALAGIGSPARENGYTVSRIESKRELEYALLQARCYYARTPEEAVYLFLRAFKEGNTIYRMSVMPEKEVPQYEAFALEWFERQDIRLWDELFEAGGYPHYFPGEISAAESFRVYNLQYDEKEGSATVKAVLRGSDGPVSAVWELALTKEKGWKVWLESQSETAREEYEPEALVSCSVRMGDFLVEMYGYNEGYFDELESFWGGARFFVHQESETQKEISFPDSFTQEYKYKYGYVTYLGEENLEGSTIKVMVTKDKEEENEWIVDQIEEIVDREYGKTDLSTGISYYGKPDLGTGISYYGESSFTGFYGRELMTGKPRLICGEGSGYSESGQCWKKGDRIEAYIRIYVDGILWEEGEVWSEML